MCVVVSDICLGLPGARPVPLDGGRRRAGDQGLRRGPEQAHDALHPVLPAPRETEGDAQNHDGLPQDRLPLQTGRAIFLLLQQWATKSKVILVEFVICNHSGSIDFFMPETNTTVSMQMSLPF